VIENGNNNGSQSDRQKNNPGPSLSCIEKDNKPSNEEGESNIDEE